MKLSIMIAVVTVVFMCSPGIVSGGDGNTADLTLKVAGPEKETPIDDPITLTLAIKNASSSRIVISGLEGEYLPQNIEFDAPKEWTRKEPPTVGSLNGRISASLAPNQEVKYVLDLHTLFSKFTPGEVTLKVRLKVWTNEEMRGAPDILTGSISLKLAPVAETKP